MESITDSKAWNSYADAGLFRYCNYTVEHAMLLKFENITASFLCLSKVDGRDSVQQGKAAAL